MNAPTATVLARLGAAAIDCGQDERAVAFFRDALSLRPDMVDAYVGLVTAHFRLGIVFLSDSGYIVSGLDHNIY